MPAAAQRGREPEPEVLYRHLERRVKLDRAGARVALRQQLQVGHVARRSPAHAEAVEGDPAQFLPAPRVRPACRRSAIEKTFPHSSAPPATVAAPRGARWPGAMAIQMPLTDRKRAETLSITAEDSAGSVLAPETASTPAARAAPSSAAEKSATKRRPSARSM